MRDEDAIHDLETECEEDARLDKLHMKYVTHEYDKQKAYVTALGDRLRKHFNSK